MGDVSEVRGLIVIITFVGSLVLLYGLIPSNFLVSYTETRSVTVPDYFDSIDLIQYAEPWNITLDETGGTAIDDVYYYTDVDSDGDGLFGGHDVDMDYKRANQTGTKFIAVLHIIRQWFGLIVDTHHLNWRNTQGRTVSTTFDYGPYSSVQAITVTQLESDMGSEGSTRYTVSCEHFYADVYFAYNTTTYSSVTDAWDHHGLSTFWGINFDQTGTSYNAWNIIGMLLFFQLPNVHWIINLMLNIPLWVGIAYLCFILILRAIGAIFGGGA